MTRSPVEASLNSEAGPTIVGEPRRFDKARRRMDGRHDQPGSIAATSVSNADTGVIPIALRPRSELATRIVNCAIASALLIVASPVLVIAAIAIKATSPGPIFYMQARVGLDRRRRRHHATEYDRRSHNLGGRVFRIYKLRTMRSDAEHQSGVVWAQQRDPRTTSIGRILRKLRIDEIPQLLNVLKGEMNIVGPRPERPSLVAKLSSGIPEYPLRHLAKPGITGLAQISQNYDSCLEDVRRKVRYDLEYLQRQDVVQDLWIMLRTVPVILFQKGW